VCWAAWSVVVVVVVAVVAVVCVGGSDFRQVQVSGISPDMSSNQEELELEASTVSGWILYSICKSSRRVQVCLL
jgi:hypothetical protein